MNSAAASTNPTPTNITLLVNRNRVNPDSLVGLTLTALEAVLSNTDEHFSKNAEDRKVLSRALNKAIQAVSKAKAGSVTLEVTSSLSPETKTITHVIQVR